MSIIRAFVGHSFLDTDEGLVRTFTNYVESLSKMDESISWCHAREAEPKEISEKVLEMIADCNVFIAICTKVEKVTNENMLEKDVWKTSDWIIQEIGLAIGKGLALVILIEDDVRQPGGLQGNIEYIKFNREAPEKSFTQINQMIKAIKGNETKSTNLIPAQSSPVSRKEKEPKETQSRRYDEPAEDWDRINYEYAYLIAAAKKDTKKCAALSAAYFSSTELSVAERGSWEAICEFYLLSFSNQGSLQKLKKLSAEHSENSEVFEFLAKGYEHYNDYKNAAENFVFASDKATNEQKCLSLLTNASVNYLRAKNSIKSSEILIKIKTKAENVESGELIILRTLRELAKESKDVENEIAALGRIVELDSSDLEARFNLAYLYSQNKNNDLTLYHYSRIPDPQKNATVWNNYGVVLDELSMPVSAVRAYRKAVEQDETLAMSNLAQKYLTAGFSEEARELCDKAISLDGYHKNVVSTLNQVRELSEEEEVKKNKNGEEVRTKVQFYSQYGKAMTKIEPTELAKIWTGPDCDLEVSIANGVFVAKGVKDTATSNMLSGLKSFRDVSAPAAKINIEYRGYLNGYAISAEIKYSEVNKQPNATTLGLFYKNSKALLIVSDDKKQIKVLQGDRLYELSCKE